MTSSTPKPHSRNRPANNGPEVSGRLPPCERSDTVTTRARASSGRSGLRPPTSPVGPPFVAVMRPPCRCQSPDRPPVFATTRMSVTVASRSTALTMSTSANAATLTAVSVAALALVDMVKAVDRDATVTDIRVVAKTGGRSGDWQRQGGRMTATKGGPTGDVGGRSPDLPEDARALVVTVSDRSHGGSRPDTSGPLLAGRLRECGFGVDDVIVVPDEVEEIQEALIEAVRMGYDVVLTTGGTGFGPRDVTPAATRGLLDRKATGLAEAIRATTRDQVPTAILSRGVAGTIGETLVINLPGSTGGVADAMAVLAPVLGHTVAQLRGGDH